MKFIDNYSIVLVTITLLSAVNQCIAKCEDMEGRVFVNAANRRKTCQWFVRRPAKNRCSLPEAIHCKSTCGMCSPLAVGVEEECVDSEEDFDIFGIARSCTWVSEKTTERLRKCDLDIVRSNCPKACNTCSSIEQQLFFIPEKKTQKSCEWAKRSKTRKRCAFDAVAKNCPLLCEQTLSSSSPSPRPSVAPSANPSRKPTVFPSSRPSVAPSASPSGKPSAFPSSSPSMAPSASPSGKPSAFPSSKPSMAPSASPSGKPSAFPSSSPSMAPSASPSGKPSAFPSSKPNMAPSASPSGRPSAFPSSQPSGAPTANPSSLLTAVPSRTLTDTPTTLPTISNQPSRLHSNQPSQTPSAQPTVFSYDKFSETTQVCSNGETRWVAINQCKAYGYCHEGTLVDKHYTPCDKGLLFDENTRRCMDSNNVSCKGKPPSGETI